MRRPALKERQQTKEGGFFILREEEGRKEGKKEALKV